MYPVAGEKSKREPLLDGVYETLAPVGRGRNSIVYRARRVDARSSDDIIALKVIVASTKEPELAIKRTKREAIAMLSSIHRNVIKLSDYVARPDLCYLAMEFADRGDLRAMLDRQQHPFAPELVLRLMLQLASGLETIHRAGIVHRDIKPENLLLTEDLILKIADFGIAFLPSERVALEEANRGVGTFDYLAPECLEEGVSNEATDIYSAAVTFYQLLTRELPFSGETFTEQINQKMGSNIIPLHRHLTEVPPFLQEFLSYALQSDPERRFRSAAEFREAIEALAEGRWEPPAAPVNGRDPLDRSIHHLQEERDAEEAFSDSGDHDLEQELNWDQFEQAHDELPTFASQGFHDELSSTSELPVQPLGHELQPGDLGDDFLVEEEDIHQKSGTQPQLKRRSRLPGIVLFVTALAVISGLVFWSTKLPAVKEAGTALLGGAEGASESKTSSAADETEEAPVTAPAEDFSALAQMPRSGTIERLLDEDGAVTFLSEPALGKRQVVVALAIPGWKPVALDSASLVDKKQITLESGGITLTLSLDTAGSAEGDAGAVHKGASLSGTFKEHRSGREGRWSLQ